MRPVITLLLLFAITTCIPYAAQSSLTKEKATKDMFEALTDTPYQQHSTYDVFTLESSRQDLRLEMFTLDGEKIPTTLYKHHRDGIVKYEIGNDLNKGLYLVKLSSEEHTQYFKLMKIQ